MTFGPQISATPPGPGPSPRSSELHSESTPNAPADKGGRSGKGERVGPCLRSRPALHPTTMSPRTRPPPNCSHESSSAQCLTNVKISMAPHPYSYLGPRDQRVWGRPDIYPNQRERMPPDRTTGRANIASGLATTLPIRPRGHNSSWAETRPQSILVSPP